MSPEGAEENHQLSGKIPTPVPTPQLGVIRKDVKATVKVSLVTEEET